MKNKKFIILVVIAVVLGVAIIDSQFTHILVSEEEMQASEREREEKNEEIAFANSHYSVELDNPKVILVGDALGDYESYKSVSGDSWVFTDLPLEKKDEILSCVSSHIDSNLDSIELSFISKIYHSSDFGLFKIYFTDTDINTQDAFTKGMLKIIFEYGLAYQRFDNKETRNVVVQYLNSDGSKELATYMSSTIDIN